MSPNIQALFIHAMSNSGGSLVKVRPASLLWMSPGLAHALIDLQSALASQMLLLLACARVRAVVPDTVTAGWP